MSITAAPSGMAEGSGAMSFGQRLVGVFLEPRKTFADIARFPDFVAPLVIVLVASIAVAEVMVSKIGMEKIVRYSLEHSSRAAQMTPEQMDQAVAQGAKVGAIIAHAGAVIVPPLFVLILAGIGIIAVNAIFGGKVNFKAAFSIACWADIVSVLAALMAVLMMLFGDTEHFNPQNFTPTNLGFFLPPDASKPLMALATSLDIFSFWLMALLGIGFSEATGGKVKALSVFLVYFGLWVLVVITKMAFATLG
jgi:hypothetical protein